MDSVALVIFASVTTRPSKNTLEFDVDHKIVNRLSKMGAEMKFELVACED